MVACRMSDMNFTHQPVLLNETITALALHPQGVYVDATFGRGGHTQAILAKLDSSAQMIIIDKDPAAIAYAQKLFAQDPRVKIHHGSFAQLQSILQHENLVGKINGILFDLGVSSPQLDEAERGFSFMREGKLDMRMDTSSGLDAATWLAQVDEKELADIIFKYGEERFSRRVARAIVAARHEKPILSTTQLRDIVARAIPVKPKDKHAATRTFQAIRIFINKELSDLEEGLEQALTVLKSGGRFVAISFHSLEDRLVKRFIQHHERGDVFPPGFPVKQEFLNKRLKRIGRALRPSAEEINTNPRARSATLRIAEKQS